MTYLIAAILILVMILVALLVLVRRTPVRDEAEIEFQEPGEDGAGPKVDLPPKQEVQEEQPQFELDFLNDAEYFKHYLGECVDRVFAQPEDGGQAPWQPMTIDDIGEELNTAIISSLSKLKHFGSAHKTLQVMDDPDVGMYKISEVIVTDPILSAEVLRVANSAFFGDRKSVV